MDTLIKVISRDSLADSNETKSKRLPDTKDTSHYKRLELHKVNPRRCNAMSRQHVT